MAQTMSDHRAGDFDRGNTLNLRNGTLDLDSLQLSDHSRDDLNTYVLDYEFDPSGDCPRWTRFVKEILVEEGTSVPDWELIGLAQELIGYSLTNDTSQEAMVWLYGAGGNGKTVLLETLRSLLGPLVVSVNFHEIGSSGNYDLARLAGKRIAMSAESERSGGLHEGYIKQIVSGETISGRAIYASSFEFQSTAKIWWAMNHLPSMNDTSNAMWRRLKLLPFNRTFANSERDPELRNKLKGELPGILNWALVGLTRLREMGSFSGANAADATMHEYQKRANPVSCWLAEARDKYGEVAAKDAYQDYRRWCDGACLKPLSNGVFGKHLKQLGIQRRRISSGTVYVLDVETTTAR